MELCSDSPLRLVSLEYGGIEYYSQMDPVYATTMCIAFPALYKFKYYNRTRVTGPISHFYFPTFRFYHSILQYNLVNLMHMAAYVPSMNGPVTYRDVIHATEYPIARAYLELQNWISAIFDIIFGPFSQASISSP